MNVKVEKIEKNLVKLEVTVEAEKFVEAMKKSYAKNAKKYNVPGFRKGKVPMNIIKKYYGEAVFYEDAINYCCEETYPVAIAENEIVPVDYPSIDIIQIGEGKDLIYSATVVVNPEVELGEYNGVEAKKNEYPVSDEEVDNQIKAMQEKNARIENKTDDAVVEKGNLVTIDFKGFIDGVAFEGGEGKDFPLEIGSGTFIDTFEDQLVGMKIGESKEVNVTFPEGYGREDLNGKPAKFEVELKAIQVKELPALDDEFAKEVSEFETLEDLKKDVKEKFEIANKERSEREYEDAVMDAVVSNAKVEIPTVMIDKEIDVMFHDLEMRLKYQGLDLDTYYKYTNNTEESVRDFMRETAEKRVKTTLVINAISKVENIDATEEELKERAENLAKQYGVKEDLEKTVQLVLASQGTLLRAEVINEKVVKMLVENSKTIA